MVCSSDYVVNWTICSKFSHSFTPSWVTRVCQKVLLTASRDEDKQFVLLSAYYKAYWDKDASPSCQDLWIIVWMPLGMDEVLFCISLNPYFRLSLGCVCLTFKSKSRIGKCKPSAWRYLCLSHLFVNTTYSMIMYINLS